MTMNKRLTLAALLLATPLAAQEPERQPPPTDPRIGVALSGGSAKGFAHVGVLRVLEQAGVPIDVLTGTSMGALVGGLYAIGYTPEMLETLALGQDWEALFTDTYERRSWTIERKLARAQLIELPIRNGRPQLPSGLVAGQRLSLLFTGLTWGAHSVEDFRTLPIPYAAVATDLETGAAVVLDHGFLPEAMRASMSLPSIFSPVPIEGRVLVDGGVARNLPAQDARALGADIVICSDVSDPLAPADSIHSLLDVLDQTISFRASAATEEQRRLCDLVIEPDIEGLSSIAFDRAAQWIERGEAATRAALPAILDLAGQGLRSPASRPRLPAVDSAFIQRVEVDGLQDARRRAVAGALNLEVPGWLTPAQIDEAIARVYNSGLFASVTYRLRPATDGDGDRMLIVSVLEEPRDRFGFSFRYETRYKASLRMSATLHNLLASGSVTRLNLRLGRQIKLDGQYFRRSGPGGLFSFGLRGEYLQAPLDIYEDGRRVAEVTSDVVNLAGFAGLGLANSVLAGLRVKGEYAHNRSAITAEPFDEKETFYTIAGLLWADTYDREDFPTRGLSLALKSEWADRSIGSGLTFSQNVIAAEAYLPVLRPVSLLARGTLGTSSGGDDLPGHYLFFLGGPSTYFVFPDRQFAFYGLDTQERRGRHLQAFGLGVQVEFAERVYTVLTWNTGNTFEAWEFDPDAYIDGYGLTLGIRTPLGPVTVTAAETTLAEWPNLSVDLGQRF